MALIDIHYVQHFQAMSERGVHVCELAQSFSFQTKKWNINWNSSVENKKKVSTDILISYEVNILILKCKNELSSIYCTFEYVQCWYQWKY